KSKILWKFTGLAGDADDAKVATEQGFAELSELAADGFVPLPVGACLGFIASPWIDGERLKARDAQNPAVLCYLGRYIARAAKPGFSERETREAMDRLGEMLYWNVKEALGERVAEQAIRASKNLRPPRT